MLLLRPAVMESPAGRAVEVHHVAVECEERKPTVISILLVLLQITKKVEHTCDSGALRRRLSGLIEPLPHPTVQVEQDHQIVRNGFAAQVEPERQHGAAPVAARGRANARRRAPEPRAGLHT